MKNLKEIYNYTSAIIYNGSSLVIVISIEKKINITITSPELMFTSKKSHYKIKQLMQKLTKMG